MIGVGYSYDAAKWWVLCQFRVGVNMSSTVHLFMCNEHLVYWLILKDCLVMDNFFFFFLISKKISLKKRKAPLSTHEVYTGTTQLAHMKNP
jgi:hypothetical protein